MAKNNTKDIDESTSVEDTSERRRIHKRGMKRAKLGAEREMDDDGVMRGNSTSYAPSGPNNAQTGAHYSISASLAPTSHVVRFFTPWSTSSSSARTHAQARKRDIHEKWRDKSKCFWHPAATGLRRSILSVL